MNPWIYGDSIRVAGNFACFCFGMWRTPLNADTRRIRNAGILGTILAIVFNIGSHDPVYFGWRVKIILSSIISLILVSSFMYFVLLISHARLRSKQRLQRGGGKKLQRKDARGRINIAVKMTRFLLGVMAIAVVVCIVGTLVTGKTVYNGARIAVMGFIVLTVGIFHGYELHKIRSEVWVLIESLRCLEVEDKEFSKNNSSEVSRLEKWQLNHDRIKRMEIMILTFAIVAPGVIFFIAYQMLTGVKSYSKISDEEAYTYSVPKSLVYYVQMLSLWIIMYLCTVPSNFGLRRKATCMQDKRETPEKISYNKSNGTKSNDRKMKNTSNSVAKEQGENPCIHEISIPKLLKTSSQKAITKLAMTSHSLDTVSGS